MKQGLRAHGFTIIEVMIVLVVTSALAVSAFALVSGQQQKTEFQQAINDIKQQIDQVINNVATGYYVNNGDINCSIIPGYPVINTANPKDRGANTGCVLLGRAMQFGVNGDKTAYNVYGIAGLQYQPGSVAMPVTQIDGTLPTSARPVVIANSSLNPTGPADAVESHRLGYGLSTQFMKDDTGGAIGTFAIITDFAQASAGNLDSGSRTAVLYSIQTTNFSNFNTLQTEDAIDNFNSAPPARGLNFHPTASVILCFVSAGTDQYGIITVGSNHRQLTTSLAITNKTPKPVDCQ